MPVMVTVKPRPASDGATEVMVGVETPRPVSSRCDKPFWPLWVIGSDAKRIPSAVALNVIVTVQLAPASSVEGQIVPLTVKSLLFKPSTGPTLMSVRATVPVLVKVATLLVLAFPVSAEPEKPVASVAGANVGSGIAVSAGRLPATGQSAAGPGSSPHSPLVASLRFSGMRPFQMTMLRPVSAFCMSAGVSPVKVATHSLPVIVSVPSRPAPARISGRPLVLKSVRVSLTTRGSNEPRGIGKPVKVSTAVPVITIVSALIAVAGMSMMSPCTWIWCIEVITSGSVWVAAMVRTTSPGRRSGVAVAQHPEARMWLISMSPVVGSVDIGSDRPISTPLRYTTTVATSPGPKPAAAT